MTIQANGFPSPDFELAPVPLYAGPGASTDPCLAGPPAIACDSGSGYRTGDQRRWIPERPHLPDKPQDCCHDESPYPRPGEPYDLRNAQRIIDQSGGRLAWAQDDRGDWWIVDQRNREDHDDRDGRRRCCDGYEGRGVRALDRCLNGYPAGTHDAEWLERAGKPHVGPGDNPGHRLRPNVDQWTLENGRRIAEQSGGALSLARDAHGDWYLIATRDRNAFEQAYGGNVWTPGCNGGSEHDFRVTQRDLKWIDAVMNGWNSEHEYRHPHRGERSDLVAIMVARRWTR